MQFLYLPVASSLNIDILDLLKHSIKQRQTLISHMYANLLISVADPDFCKSDVLCDNAVLCCYRLYCG